MIGSGQFGKVHEGEWTAPGTETKINVAVKTLKEGAGEQDKVKFLQEAAIMGQFSHPNVVKLHGVITEGEPVSLASTSILLKLMLNNMSSDNDSLRVTSKRRSSQPSLQLERQVCVHSEPYFIAEFSSSLCSGKTREMNTLC